MSAYDHLPVEERIRLASEYAVILTFDDNPELDVIAELMHTFDITRSEAQSAYARMRTHHRGDYKKALTDKIKRAYGSAVAMLLLAISCGAFASVTGWFYLLMAFAFGGGFSSSIILIAKWSRERDSNHGGSDIMLPTGTELKNAMSDDWRFSLPFAFLVLLAASWLFFYSRSRVIDLNEIKTVNGLVLNNFQKKSKWSGKHRTHYFELKFAGYPQYFEFEEGYYDYADISPISLNLKVGDTLSIELKQSQADKKLNDMRDNVNIEVINIRAGSQWLIRQAYRNKQVEDENSKNFRFAGLAYIFATLISFLWMRYGKKNRRTDEERNR